ncbi:MAG: carboxypeptidase regulatory-like domain-containing protein, partial [Acidimicrobiia bacterium]
MTSRRALTFAAFGLVLIGFVASAYAQATTGTILGIVKDQQGGVIQGATITVKHLETNATRTAISMEGGQFRITNLPAGTYEVNVESSGFARYMRSSIRLAVNQDAEIDVTLQPAGVTETINVQADSPILNTTTPEVGVRFDTQRIAELPVNGPPGGTFRDIFALALAAPGVSQLGTGQSNFATGINYSANGMRTRSNNFMIDGQDSNDPSISGRQQPINNTDIVSEVRLITNQFAADFGRTAGSVMNVITKSGTNNLHGSGFWYQNDDALNARSNLDKGAGRTKAPFREEKQFGGTLGGPVMRDRTFFFGSYQRWTDDALGSGQTIN